jgi:hypothetical protein
MEPYGARPARTTFGLLLVLGYFVTAFRPLAVTIVDSNPGLIVPSRAFF